MFYNICIAAGLVSLGIEVIFVKSITYCLVDMNLFLRYLTPYIDSISLKCQNDNPVYKGLTVSAANIDLRVPT